jgi:hypothetical protein
MAFSPANAVDASVGVFGGCVTEMSPINLPEGVSPDCPECAFAPGSVFTRAAFEKVFSPPLGPNVTITYGKSFVAPDGTIFNFYLGSNGVLYLENLTLTPGIANSLFISFPGTYARSATAFGREYIAISDGRHGADIPLQFDGTNLDRVTEDGPGAPPTVQSVALPSTQMAASGNTLTRNNNYVTAVTANPHNLQVGYLAQVSNVPDSNSTSVEQTRVTGNITANGTYWGFASGLYRSVFAPGTSPLSAFLFITDGLAGFSIPSSATILGVVVSLDTYLQGPSSPATIASIALWQTGAQLGTAKTPGTALTTSPTSYPFGSSADLWGASLTPAIVNDPTFGFAVSITLGTERVFIQPSGTFQVFYTLSGSGTVAEIESIVIDNEVSPGLALVTTTAPHGLAPEEFVSIVGVEPATVADVAAAQWVAGVTTLTTATNHNLTPGALIQVADVTTSTGSTTFSFNGTFSVATVPAPDQVTYIQVPITASDPDVINATASTGAITVAWPIPDNTPTPTYFEVDSAPTSNTFYIQVNYSDGTWTTGTVGFIWEGTFYVTQVLSPTSFVYQQYGPNGATTAVGTVTPFGQAAPGIHLVRVSYLTRQGFLTKPSPWVQFIANGGQYLQMSLIPTGPSNIVARVLEFTGALGSLFYYIPTVPQVNGIIVGTPTQINDNTTTSILLDFSDNTLFTGLGTSIPGNNTPAQITLDGALGFASFDNYNVTWGQRNKVNGFLNMDFEGGSAGTILPISPSGWEFISTGGLLIESPTLPLPRSGFGWQVTIPAPGGSGYGKIQQGAYADVNGATILQPNTQYAFRFFASTTVAYAAVDFVVTAELFDTGTGGEVANASANITFVQLADGSLGAWTEVNFNTTTPDTIPPGLVLWVSVFASAGSVITLDELSILFTETPFTDTILNFSYEDNPEAFDGITGETGPSTDPNQVMDFATISDIPYILTLDPSGRLHEITSTATSLPSGWQVNERAANCGVLSAFSLTKSQADDNSSSGGEEWFAWASETGARIFGGNQVWKISQEIQPNWNDNDQQQSPLEINMQAQLTAWSLNDPVGRVLYFGLPLGTATAPSAIYAMNYRELDSAESIAFSPPYRVAFSGKLIATDNTRKWSFWARTMNGAARMYRQSGITPCFFAGNGAAPVAGAGFGNVYVLNPNQETDDDYGQINSYYVTCALPTRDQEQGLQLGASRKLLTYITAYIQASANVSIFLYPANLENQWPLSITRQPGQNPNFDLECTGLNCEAYRMFFKIQPSPLAGQTDNSFALQRFSPYFKKSRMAVRGSAT